MPTLAIPTMSSIERTTLGGANVGTALGSTTANGDQVIDHLRGASAKTEITVTSGYARA